MKLLIKILLIIVVVVAFTGCGGESNEPETAVFDSSERLLKAVEKPADFDSYTLAAKVEFYIQNDQYLEALELLSPLDENEQETRELLIASHMTYGLYLTYGSLSDMRTRMPEALRQFRRVVQLDPQNAQAKAEIEQIEGIYRSLNRDIPQGVAE